MSNGKRLHEIPAIIFGIAPQLAAETGRICEKLELAVAEVEAMTWPVPSARFSELVRHARKMHSMLVEALLAVRSEVPRNLRVARGNRIRLGARAEEHRERTLLRVEQY